LTYIHLTTICQNQKRNGMMKSKKIDADTLQDYEIQQIKNYLASLSPGNNVMAVKAYRSGNMPRMLEVRDEWIKADDRTFTQLTKEELYSIEREEE